ncbi:MAG: glycosyltransferase family 2 protein [Patescibacteria group bacterium]
MKKNLLLSVVMPVYNSEKYLSEAIESILDQTFENFEFIIVDDGSTDNSLKIINQYQDSRIKVIKHKINKGLIYSLNEGFKEASGKYIARMDADDISVKTRFVKQVKFLEKNKDIAILGSWIKNFGNKNYVWETITNPNLIRARMLFESCLAHPSVIIRKKDLVTNNLSYDPKYKYAEDFALWVKSAEKIKITNYPEILLHYRTHSEQTPIKSGHEQQESSWKIRKYQLHKLGIKPNKEYKNIHQKLSSWSKDVSFKEFAEIATWLRLILLQNLKTKYFEQKSLTKIIGERWAGMLALNYKNNPLILVLAIIHFDLTLLSICFLLTTKFFKK